MKHGILVAVMICTHLSVAILAFVAGANSGEREQPRVGEASAARTAGR